MMQRFDSLLDAASSLIRAGYRYDADYHRFVRGSWYAHLTVQKNGRVAVRVS